MTGTGVDTGTVAPLVGTLPPQCQKDVDTLRRVVRERIGRGPLADPVSPAAFREVFLTGATGFVGRFLLRDILLQDDELVVHCLVRAEDEAHGLERLRAALRLAEIWEDSFADRLRVVVGDVCDARFGLSEPDFSGLCRRTDAVYHLAADLTLASPYLSIRRINTFSICNILDLCLRTRLKHLFFTSSMSVFPEYFLSFADEFGGRRIEHQMQPDLTDMKSKYPLALLGYPWCKLVTEQALLFARSAGLPVGIFRLPRAGAASTGIVTPQDIGVTIAAAVADVGMMPRGFSLPRVNESVDVVTRICASISRNPRRRHTIYHCCDSHPPVHDVEPADFGAYWREVSYASFKRACQGRGERSPLHAHWALLDHFAPYWFGNTDIRAGQPICDRAVREDCPEPIEWPGLLTIFERTSGWIRRHRDRWPYPVAESRLDFECLLSQARRYAERAGVPFERACPEWMRHGLEQLVNSLAAPEAALLDERRGFLVFDLSRLLRNNAALARASQEHPEIARQEVTRPVFIVGINRTGTTLLHRLMARDSRFWTLCGYECFEPVDPTGDKGGPAGAVKDPRREALRDILEAVGAVENFTGIHNIDIDEPEEDFPLLRLAFAAWTTLVRYHLPDYARWLAATGSQHAYAHHRRIVQYFTWRRRRCLAGTGGQWLFKMPFHLKELEALTQAYPDALFIQTHRAPSEVMGSWNSLVERVRSVAIEPRPPQETGIEQLDFMSRMLNGAMHFRMAHPELEDRWIDVAFVDLVRDPMAVVRAIYDRFGWRLEQAAVDGMDEWLSRQAEQRRRETRHRYRLEDYGLTAERVDAAFAPYLDFIAARGPLSRD